MIQGEEELGHLTREQCNVTQKCKDTEKQKVWKV